MAKLKARILLSFLGFCCCMQLGTVAFGAVLEQKVKIEYLYFREANISAHAINRLHFDKFSVVKIVGDSSKYQMRLSSNGRDLFLTSKVASSEVIRLSVIMSNGQVIDLKLNVRDIKDGAILNINITDNFSLESEEKQIAGDMIEHMVTGKQGKYFAQKVKGKVSLAYKPNLLLKKYISYRYGDFTGIGFTFTNRYSKARRLIEKLDKEEIAWLFENVVAVGIKADQQNWRKGKLFVVFKDKKE